MTANPSAPARQDPRTRLRQLRRDHPQCEIRLIATQVREPVSRPAPGRTVVHCAASIDELRAKIEADAS